MPVNRQIDIFGNIFFDFGQVRWFGGPPHIFFSIFFRLEKFLRPFIFFLRKRGAKQIDNERVAKILYRGGNYDPPLALQGLSKDLKKDPTENCIFSENVFWGP